MSRTRGVKRGIPGEGALRPMVDADLERVLGWRNHPDVRRWMYTSHEIELDEHRRWFRGASQDERRHLLVYELDGEPCGYVNVTSEGGPGGPGTWGFYLSPDAPRGAGRGLGLAALRYAFEVVGLGELRGEALSSNVNSIAFHRRLGFTETEERLGHHVAEDGERHDVSCFQLSRGAWREQAMDQDQRT